MYRNNNQGPKRGVALYSYSAEFGFEKTLEDCFEDIHDMGATGVEILANTHIENYPYPTDEWVNYWFSLCDKYQVEPVEYGHWIDCRVLQDRLLSTEEAVARLEQDLRLAHRLGFKVLRTKMSVVDDALNPVENWREIIRGALPLAERLGLTMCPEIHIPTNLKSQMIIDFSVFRHKFDEGEFVDPHFVPNEPEDIIPLIPYIYCCHAKFIHMNDDFEETTIPYKEVLMALRDNGYNGYLLSEYEGADKYDQGYEVGQTLRKHHIMMKNILGY